MLTKILNILLILLLLGLGMRSYALMPALMLMLSHSTMLVIAIGARLLGLIFIVSIITLSGVTQSGYYMNGHTYYV